MNWEIVLVENSKSLECVRCCVFMDSCVHHNTRSNEKMMIQFILILTASWELLFLCARIVVCRRQDKRQRGERREKMTRNRHTNHSEQTLRECKQQKEFSLSPFWHSHFSSKKHNGPNQFSSSSQQQLHPYFKFHFPPTVPIKNSSNKMSYAYLFKYIIIGDTGAQPDWFNLVMSLFYLLPRSFKQSCQNLKCNMHITSIECGRGKMQINLKLDDGASSTMRQRRCGVEMTVWVFLSILHPIYGALALFPIRITKITDE